jgi:hypothetical protein
MRMPSSLASAAATSCCAASSTVSPSITKSVALCSVSGMSCATWAMRHWRDRVVATVFVQAAVEQAEQGGLAGAVAPHQADLLAGVEGDGRCRAAPWRRGAR